MSRVRTRDTEPELRLRRELYKQGVRYRLHRKDLPGTPDIYVPRLRLAIFVNGCFWHGHNCTRGRRPSSNTDFWNTKIDRNRVRDVQVERALGTLGIEFMAVWQCTVREFDSIASAIAKRYGRVGRASDVPR
jgi:DNA mismatch endonuclease (patch repair protein)